MKKGIIFDLDGVLVNSMPSHVQAWKAAFAEVAGINLTDREIYLLEGMRGMELITKIFEDKGVRDSSLATAVHEEKSRVFKAIRSSDPFEGVPEMINNMNCVMSVVSGSARTDVETILDEAFGDHKFAAVITSDDIEKGKPDPSAFLEALGRMKLDATQAAVVENAPLGVKSAANTGIDCFIVLNNTPLKRSDFGIVSDDRILQRTSMLSDLLGGSRA